VLINIAPVRRPARRQEALKKLPPLGS